MWKQDIIAKAEDITRTKNTFQSIVISKLPGNSSRRQVQSDIKTKLYHYGIMWCTVAQKHPISSQARSDEETVIVNICKLTTNVSKLLQPIIKR